MPKLTSHAIVLIAAYALSTGVSAQNTYKCGNSYSQIPCPGALMIDARDARDNAQKTQADLATLRDAKVADSLETARRQKEQADAQANTPTLMPANPAAVSSDGAPRGKPPTQLKKKKGPEYFTAQVPGEKKSKPLRKKKVSKKNAESA